MLTIDTKDMLTTDTKDMLTIDTKVKQKVIAEYRSQCRSVLSTHLNGDDSYAISVMCYSAGITGLKQSLMTLTITLLTVYIGLHPKADVDHPRKSGGRGDWNIT